MINVRGAARLLIIVSIVVSGVGLAAAPASAAPALTITPGPTGLLDQQVVTVTGTGFDADETLLITHCIGPVPTGCAMDPQINRNGAYAMADQSGAVSATLRLPRELVLPGGDGGGCENSDCSIVAIARDDTAERARTFIDFEPIGTAPGYPAGTTQVTTIGAGVTNAIVEVSGSGFQPWFLAQPYYFDGNDLPISEAETIGSEPGAYLTLCPNDGETPGWNTCTRAVGPQVISPGTPIHGARQHRVDDVQPDGTVTTVQTYSWPRMWTILGVRIDCAVEDCRFVLEQDSPIGEGATVDWAPEWHPWPTATAFIEAAYLGLMGREPRPDETSYLRTALEERTITGRGFLMSLAASSDGRRVAELSRLYRAALDRLPDAAGLTYWAEELEANGGSMSAIARAFGRTSEFRTSFGSGSNAAAVTRAYRRTLGRSPGPSESAYWVGRLDAGLARTHMIHLFARTPEYLDREGSRSQGTAVMHGLKGWIPTTSQWSYMDVDRPADPEDPFGRPAIPRDWRVDDTLLQFLGGFSV